MIHVGRRIGHKYCCSMEVCILTMAYSSSTIVAWKYTYDTGNTIETLYTLAMACKDGTGKYGNTVETVYTLANYR